MRNRSQKTAETLLLEPTKNKEKRLRKVASSKAQRKRQNPSRFCAQAIAKP